MNDIIYNGQSLRDLGYAVKTFPVHTVAERDMEFSSIIGRSGDIIVDNKRFHNVDMNYEINMIDIDRLQNTDVNERRLIDWLMSGDAEYKNFEDSTVPGYFCKAICKNIGEIARNGLNGYIDTAISFNRQPFWYSKVGQKKQTFEASKTEQTITNPEKFISEPYFKITADLSGIGETSLIVNGEPYTLANSPSYIEIDSEEYNVFQGTVDCNDYAKFNYMPFFKPGVNTFAVEAKSSAMQKHILSVEIIPRWRRL